MKRPGVIGTLAWVVLVAVAAFVVVRARYTTDLSAFLPRSPTATQRLLVDQLRDGLASRLIIVALEGADSQTRARVSVAMANRLRSDWHGVRIRQQRRVFWHGSRQGVSVLAPLPVERLGDARAIYRRGPEGCDSGYG